VWVRVPPPLLEETPANPHKNSTAERSPPFSSGLFYTDYYTNALGKGVLHRGEYMRVGVQGDGDTGVPQHLGDDLGVHVLAEVQRGARML
jgi:hypothetical protein